MKTTYYALYPVETFKKLVFFKLRSMGFNKTSEDTFMADAAQKTAVAKSFEEEIEKIEATLNDYKNYLNEFTSETK